MIFELHKYKNYDTKYHSLNRSIIADIIDINVNDHWKVLYKVSVFYADRKSKMAATAGHRLTLDPMGKYSNAFFSETTHMIKAF
jgi:hypothetical protein